MNLHSRNKPMLRHPEGFTLLEVLISIVLLVVISLAIYQTTTETFRLRDILMNEGEFYNSIRLSMGVVDRDVAMLFSPINLVPDAKPSASPEDIAQMEEVLTSELGQNTLYWSPAIDMNGIRPSHFVGTDSKMSFISLSHIRLYKESNESEFAKIIYELKDDPDRETAIEGTKILIKGESPNAFDSDDKLDDKTFTYYPLLRGISKFQIRYFHKEKDQWRTDWDSDKEELRNIYPDRIEINLEVKGPSRLFFEGSYHFKPEIPLYGLKPTT